MKAWESFPFTNAIVCCEDESVFHFLVFFAGSQDVEKLFASRHNWLSGELEHPEDFDVSL